MNTDAKELTGDITLLPWEIPTLNKLEVAIYKNDCWIGIATTKVPYSGISNLVRENNAAYIVKACNLFPDLVEALEKMTYIVGDAKDGQEIWLNDEGWNNYSKAKELIQKAKQ